ncbi:hypothetical protein [Wenxinia marina]|uniref:FlgN protein n=1 Tax=Wenxinia marina DSM 24838 TaxID=1123501 RepID=A0A0D0QJB5_9RHOB|nr:hypothetical protein [Wenxinia marina]KIQ71123.1 hypothetical protein Wenmar_00502 [Wenxinia marina DSM 24838]GGL54652.1 hypothetical protein GCM10011392_06340 [Wenxinia marina]
MDDGELSRLQDLLAREREALLMANYAVLPALAPEKARLVARLGGAGISRTALRRAEAGLRRNQALLASALSGLRDAAARAELRRGIAAALTTYDRDGALSRHGPAGGDVEHKA